MTETKCPVNFVHCQDDCSCYYRLHIESAHTCNRFDREYKLVPRAFMQDDNINNTYTFYISSKDDFELLFEIDDCRRMNFHVICVLQPW